MLSIKLKPCVLLYSFVFLSQHALPTNETKRETKREMERKMKGETQMKREREMKEEMHREMEYKSQASLGMLKWCSPQNCTVCDRGCMGGGVGHHEQHQAPQTIKVTTTALCNNTTAQYTAATQQHNTTIAKQTHTVLAGGS